MLAPTQKKSVLGKGLGALLDTSDVVKHTVTHHTQAGVSEVDLSFIEANPNQPRSRFDEEALVELSENIKQVGLIQPITIREIEPNRYQIISGERRWRASKMAGLERIPAYIRKTNDEEVLLLALIENVQREDLDAIEIAVSYQRLIDECKLTQEKLSERVSKPRATIANYLRLLNLSPEIQAGIINKDISMGHAKVLVGVADKEIQSNLFTQIISNDLSVRKVEELAKDFQAQAGQPGKAKSKTDKKLPEEYVALQDHLTGIFKSKIKLKKTPDGKGEIVIPFVSDEDFDRLISIMEKIQA